jgi:hypothetical protein
MKHPAGAAAMAHATMATTPDAETTDHAAILLMLSYVEAECLRLGATDAAKHAALAASCMPNPPSEHRVALKPIPGGKLH